MSAWDRLAQVQDRAEKATDGPWGTLKDTWKGGTPVHRIGSDPTGDDVALTYRYEEAPEDRQGARDAEFIAHARTDVPRLVAALRAALDLHKAISEEGFDVDVCERCSSTAGAGVAVSWPCLTVRVIENALKEN